MNQYLLIWRKHSVHLPWQYPFAAATNDHAISFARRQIQVLTDVESLELWKTKDDGSEICVAYVSRKTETDVLYNPVPLAQEKRG